MSVSGGRCRALAPETHLYDNRLDDVIQWLMSQGVATNHGDEENIFPHKRGVGSGWLCTFVLDSVLAGVLDHGDRTEDAEQDHEHANLGR